MASAMTFAGGRPPIRTPFKVCTLSDVVVWRPFDLVFTSGKMTHHPHVHMIVPGGGITIDGST
jgi:hypothetical protein